MNIMTNTLLFCRSQDMQKAIPLTYTALLDQLPSFLLRQSMEK